jgi:hypothetical protein
MPRSSKGLKPPEDLIVLYPLSKASGNLNEPSSDGPKTEINGVARSRAFTL